jgi:DNA-binding response OmpR family regulator
MAVPYANIEQLARGRPESSMDQIKRVLVADDSEAVTTVLATALELEGFEVDTTDNGLSAYQMGIDGGYDLVILDHLMPGLLGLEVLERWRREGYEVRTIVVSGIDDDRTPVASLEAGADFVRKPFRMPELMARIRANLYAAS